MVFFHVVTCTNIYIFGAYESISDNLPNLIYDTINNIYTTVDKCGILFFNNSHKTNKIIYFFNI